MEVEQTNFATHLIITVCTIIIFFLSKNPSVKIWSNKINYYSKLCASLYM